MQQRLRTLPSIFRSEYNSWRSMKRRCFNENEVSYRYVGGRGLSMCNRWLSFANFLADMGPKPGDGYSIERIDNAKGYEPSNCKWATPLEQAQNTCKVRWLTCFGVTLSVSEWSRRCRIPASTILCRLDSFGWSVEKALTIPPVMGAAPVNGKRNQWSRRGTIPQPPVCETGALAN